MRLTHCTNSRYINEFGIIGGSLRCLEPNSTTMSSLATRIGKFCPPLFWDRRSFFIFWCPIITRRRYNITKILTATQNQRNDLVMSQELSGSQSDSIIMKSTVLLRVVYYRDDDNVSTSIFYYLNIRKSRVAYSSTVDRRQLRRRTFLKFRSVHTRYAWRGIRPTRPL
jgi:hypothetical protein